MLGSDQWVSITGPDPEKLHSVPDPHHNEDVEEFGSRVVNQRRRMLAR